MTAPQQPATGPPLVVKTRRLAFLLLWVCVAVELLLVVLDCFVNYGNALGLGPMQRLCDITREDALGAWFSESLTLLVGLTAWLICVVVRHQGEARWRKAGWCFLAILFTYLAIDDGAMIHERAGDAFKALRYGAPVGEGDSPVENRSGGAYPSYAWQILFIPLFGAAGIYMLAFLLRELYSGRLKLLVLAALACLATAQLLDFFEGLPQTHRWNIYVWIIDKIDLIDFTARHFDSLPYATVAHFSRSLEEFLEMLGMTLFWVVFIRQLGWVASAVPIRLSDPGTDGDTGRT